MRNKKAGVLPQGPEAHTQGNELALRLSYQFAESKPNSKQAAAGDPIKERCAAGPWATSQSAQRFVYLWFLQASWNLLLASEKKASGHLAEAGKYAALPQLSPCFCIASKNVKHWPEPAC